VIEALLEAEVTAKLGRAKGAVHHISGQPRSSDWVCGYRCCADADARMSVVWALCALPLHVLGEI
jgi:hypothetical protein